MSRRETPQSVSRLLVAMMLRLSAGHPPGGLRIRSLEEALKGGALRPPLTGYLLSI
jgi:hypothetical protein